ncbi:MAG TPA: adenylate/guanylate cyclase domain-containing protein [Anaerolineales bacterium]|nr:adenylate/guanylate cyclase domain-containing protein [Anaerolineales bacterium]
MDTYQVKSLIPGRAGRIPALTAAIVAVLILVLTPIWSYQWMQLPFLGVLLEGNNHVNQAVSAGWPAYEAGVQPYDRLAVLNGQSVENPAQDQAFIKTNGTNPVQATFVRLNGSRYTIQVTPLVRMPFNDLFSLYIVPYLVGLVFLGIGFWAYSLRSDMPAGRVLLVYVSTLCIIVAGFFDLATTNHATIIWTLALILNGAALTHLALVFPQPIRQVQERHYLLWIPWIISLVFLPFMTWAVLYPPVNTPLDDASWRWGYLYMVVSTLLFIGMLIYRVFQSDQPSIRQQSRIMIFGALIAFLPGVIYLGPLAFGILTEFRAWLVFIPLIFFPLSITYAVLRYRLLDVDRFFSRALAYLITIGIAFIVFYALLALLSQLLNRAVRSNDPFVTGSYLLLLVIGFIPLRDQIQRAIDRAFYRAPADYRRVLTTLSQGLVVTPDLTQTLRLLETQLYQALAPERFVIYLYNDELGEYFPHATHEDSAPPYQVDDPLVRLIEKSKLPIWLPAEGALPSELEGTAASLNRLAGFTFVPLRYEGRLIGFMCLGPRRSGVLYTADDLDFLAAVAGQSTLALENARLFANLRRTLDQTLEMKNLMDDIFSSIATGVITTDIKRRVTLLNRAAEQILGVRVTQALGKPLAQALPVIGSDLASVANSTLQNGESILSEEWSRTLPERGDLHLRLSVSPLRDAYLETKGATFVFEDLTERRKLEAEQERIRRTFGRVVAPRVRDRLLADPTNLKLDGVKRNVTILFADLTGFTPYSEAHQPEAVFSVLNSYLALAAQAILEHEGTLDKFMGDAVLAIWNSPDLQEDHALRAVRAAYEIVNRSIAAHAQFALPEQHLIFRIGITTGPAIIGNVGTDELFNYTAIGDTVNLAQRLQTSAERGQILLEKATYQIVADHILAAQLKPITVKGRQQAVEVYELKGLK